MSWLLTLDWHMNWVLSRCWVFRGWTATKRYGIRADNDRVYSVAITISRLWHSFVPMRRLSSDKQSLDAVSTLRRKCRSSLGRRTCTAYSNHIAISANIADETAAAFGKSYRHSYHMLVVLLRFDCTHRRKLI